jgi:hypothetical protein
MVLAGREERAGQAQRPWPPFLLRLRRKSSAKWRRSDRLPKSRPELQIRIMQLDRERSPPPGLRRPQAKLSRKSNQVARGRFRQFESYMPSHAVRLSKPIHSCTAADQE